MKINLSKKAKKTEKKEYRGRYFLLFYSSQMGNAKAMNSLGKFIQFSSHLFKNDLSINHSINISPSFVFDLYNQSADQNFPKAFSNLGNFYYSFFFILFYLFKFFYSLIN